MHFLRIEFPDGIALLILARVLLGIITLLVFFSQNL